MDEDRVIVLSLGDQDDLLDDEGSILNISTGRYNGSKKSTMELEEDRGSDYGIQTRSGSRRDLRDEITSQRAEGGVRDHRSDVYRNDPHDLRGTIEKMSISRSKTRSENDSPSYLKNDIRSMSGGISSSSGSTSYHQGNSALPAYGIDRGYIPNDRNSRYDRPMSTSDYISRRSHVKGDYADYNTPSIRHTADKYRPARRRSPSWLSKRPRSLSRDRMRSRSRSRGRSRSRSRTRRRLAGTDQVNENTEGLTATTTSISHPTSEVMSTSDIRGETKTHNPSTENKVESHSHSHSQQEMMPARDSDTVLGDRESNPPSNLLPLDITKLDSQNTDQPPSNETIPVSGLPSTNNENNSVLINEIRKEKSGERYFVMRLRSKDEFEEAKREEVWPTSPLYDQVLQDAYNTSSAVFLAFTINLSREFCSIAKMVSDISWFPERTIFDKSRFRRRMQLQWLGCGSVTYDFITNQLNLPRYKAIRRHGEEIEKEIGEIIYEALVKKDEADKK